MSLMKPPKSAFKKLLTLDMDAVRSSEVEVIEWLADEWMDNVFYNQPILASSITLQCELGNRWFRDGVANAKAVGLVP